MTKKHIPATNDKPAHIELIPDKNDIRLRKELDELIAECDKILPSNSDIRKNIRLTKSALTSALTLSDILLRKIREGIEEFQTQV